MQTVTILHFDADGTSQLAGAIVFVNRQTLVGGKGDDFNMHQEGTTKMITFICCVTAVPALGFGVLILGL